VTLITEQVRDWAGGTRIGAALAAFNRQWARRTLSGRATVLLVSDGIDLEHIDLLDRKWRACAALRIASSGSIRCCAIGVSPQARGMQAILPHVDALRAHNLDSLFALESLLDRHPARCSTRETYQPRQRNPAMEMTQTSACRCRSRWPGKR
jgi:uncharacterized protein with von Willebrand factor type A (vWA) domain